MRRLRDFWTVHPRAERPLRAWYMQVEHVQWQSFADVKRTFPTAAQVKRLTVFNISGNHFRSIVRIEYEQQKVYIRFVLTHTEYDREEWKQDDWYE